MRLREPDLLMVITGGPIAYTRADGVHMVPLGCLKDQEAINGEERSVMAPPDGNF